MHAVKQSLFRFTEIKDTKLPTTNKTDSLDHHQHNGNLKAILPIFNSDSDCGKALENDEQNRVISVDIEKANDAEIAYADDCPPAAADSDKNASDEYEHSLWKFPFKRSWFTQVYRICFAYILVY